MTHATLPTSILRRFGMAARTDPLALTTPRTRLTVWSACCAAEEDRTENDSA
jgi:hypothetical protein